MAITERSIGLNRNFANMEHGLVDPETRYYYNVEFPSGRKRIVRSKVEIPVGALVSAEMKWGFDTGTVLSRTTEKPDLHNYQMPKIKRYLVRESTKKITGLLVRPGKVPEVVEIENTEAALEELLGNIGSANINHHVKLLNGDRDGHLMNRAIYQDGWQIAAIVSGSFLVVGDDAGETVSLSADDLEKYRKMFEVPDVFAGASEKIQEKMKEMQEAENDARFIDIDDDDDDEDYDDDDEWEF